MDNLSKAKLNEDVIAIARDDARMIKVDGCARSGKTEALIERAAQLIDKGTAPENILIEATTAFAVQALKRRLASRVNHELAERVFVATPLEISLRVLSTQQAREATGRGARLLADFEYKIILEDLKTTGIQRRKLRNALAFFSEEWAAFTPEENLNSCGHTQEADILKLLRECLINVDAILAPEAPYLCARYLQSDTGTNAAGSFEYVLCDDFQNMSHVEQTMLCLMASKQLVVTGNVAETVRPDNGHPYPDGFANFDLLRKGVKVHTLLHAFGNADIQNFANALAYYGSSDDKRPAITYDSEAASVTIVKWATPDDELNNLTKYLRSRLDSLGTELESRVCIVAPNQTWAAALKRICLKRGFKVGVEAAGFTLSGDPRDNKHNHALRAYTALNLLAEPHDLVAWRCWCGYGNYLTNSDVWKHLASYAKDKDIGVLEALNDISTKKELPFPRAEVLVDAYKKGSAFIQKNAEHRGFVLLHVLGADNLAEFDDIARNMAGDESATELFSLVRQTFTDPIFSKDIHELSIVRPENLVGLEFDEIYVLGVINGFFPPRKAFEAVGTEKVRSKIKNTSRRIFANLVGKANKTLLISTFSSADLELAERTKMQVKRIRSEKGRRVALLAPSIFLAETQDAYPGTIGGQQLLTDAGL